VTQGHGASHNPVLSLSGKMLAFDSTNDEAGNDTGISQIWLVTTTGTMAVTNGAGPSRSPDMTFEGRVLAFESSAALTGDGHDTGVTQIFAYDTRANVLTQVTNEPTGCSRPAIDPDYGDWRIAFVCNATGYFHLLNANKRFQLPFPDGDDTRQIVGLGPNFLLVSTTTDLSCPICRGPDCAVRTCSSTSTTDHQLFLLNKWKLPGVPVTPTPP